MRNRPLPVALLMAQENPLSIFTAAKLHNVAQKNITLWGYVADPLVFVVNKDIWASWTP